MDKYGTAIQTTDINTRIIWHMHIACWITKLQTHIQNM